MSKVKLFSDLLYAEGKIDNVIERPVVCIQGLGFVGFVMALAVASARNKDGEPYFNVIGIELANPEGQSKVDLINKGEAPFTCTDIKISEALSQSRDNRNLVATTDQSLYSMAQTVVINVPLDLIYVEGKPSFLKEDFKDAIGTIGQSIKPGALVIVETTVPPGTCEKVVAPLFAQSLNKRDLAEDSILLAHSYERVMPGREYFDSIVNFWRVYSGYTLEAADACEAFLSKVINVKEYPLKRLESTTASETAKVLENSYRAVNIAFMEEWGRFAEAVGIDIFDIVGAIRKRPTHSNIRQPGFGVGGYCLTKDPLFADISAREIYGLDDLNFSFCELAVEKNSVMPLVSLEKIKALFLEDLSNIRILLLGISYRQDVGDTRYSPSEVFVRKAQDLGAKVVCHDPLIEDWPEMGLKIPQGIPKSDGTDAVVFAVPHKEYQELDVSAWVNGTKPVVLDANNVLSKNQLEKFQTAGCKVISIGRGIG